MRDAITNFIAGIAEPHFPNMFNPWSQSCDTEIDSEGWKDRRKRLLAHLSCQTPRILVIGEAPGYQGCRYSGIAFTSERLLLEGAIPRIEVLEGRITHRPRPWSEPSATIVWKALYEFGVAEDTVMFNAVPWHPQGNKGPLSNRTPTQVEKQAGLEHLKLLLDIFHGIHVVALGNTASDSLSSIDCAHEKLRHPANGGATEFREGLSRVVR
ncbi:MAG: uracil-DNA glycosylase [Candidatus Thiodiazotropha endolucinida]|nr:uracil-DNA glycosylase [Candidatus Thiodiazotropha taylori]MCW4268086.1 uracil-DNA glycosylase [Candidatus Thiodiazotropha endolucinida]